MSVPHTPISYIESGGSQFFSAECQQALLNCNMHPDNFGGYDKLARDKAEAVRKVEDWQNAQRAGNTAGVPEPTMRERQLANSTVGHLTQDATQRAPGGRGDPCENVVDGYL